MWRVEGGKGIRAGMCVCVGKKLDWSIANIHSAKVCACARCACKNTRCVCVRYHRMREGKCVRVLEEYAR